MEEIAKIAMMFSHLGFDKNFAQYLYFAWDTLSSWRKSYRQGDSKQILPIVSMIDMIPIHDTYPTSNFN